MSRYMRLTWELLLLNMNRSCVYGGSLARSFLKYLSAHIALICVKTFIVPPVHIIHNSVFLSHLDCLVSVPHICFLHLQYLHGLILVFDCIEAGLDEASFGRSEDIFISYAVRGGALGVEWLLEEA